ncbi:hypothetical protein Vadar_005690 [Vaccinium darrowii]|uniref:Uncharacterized protein n=1 Tax=Vaccinium darrowii TaxID=229202 RepID=A0ACB7YUA3_9ERIC|nr:hypothetical protein Vadar_005690 [Vaccinium darrowii]
MDPAGFERGQSSSHRSPISPFIDLPTLMSKLSTLFPPAEMDLIEECYNEFREGNITRKKLVKRLRLLAGDQMLSDIILDHNAEGYSGVGDVGFSVAAAVGGGEEEEFTALALVADAERMCSRRGRSLSRGGLCRLRQRQWGRRSFVVATAPSRSSGRHQVRLSLLDLEASIEERTPDTSTSSRPASGEHNEAST